MLLSLLLNEERVSECERVLKEARREGASERVWERIASMGIMRE